MTDRVRPWASGSVAVPTGTQAAAFDRAACDEFAVPEAVLMERAGAAAARIVAARLPRPVDRPILVVAGMGKNGGDGLVVARCLAAWGIEVNVLRPRDEAGGRELLHGWNVPVHSADRMADDTLHALLSTASGVVDALLGTGLTEAPREDVARILEAFTKARGPIFALDLPSGVLADDGRVPGAVVTADATIAFGFPKLGTLLHPGRAHCGRLLAVEIGFPPRGSLAAGEEWYQALTPAWAADRRPRRRPDTHKNRVGALTLVAGRERMAGAAVLAGRSALRAGTGYLRIAAPAAALESVGTALPDAVLVDRSDEAALDDALEAGKAVVAGPAAGTGDEMPALLRRILGCGRPVLLDADALTVLGREGPDAFDIHDRVVLTPHPGEAARLLGWDTEEVQADRPAALEALVDRWGCAVVLKGTPTLAAAGGRRFVDTVATSDLAVAGMGDVLAGAIGGFLAQGLPLEAAIGVGLVSTARAATRAGQGSGLQASDVPEHLPAALGEGWGDTDLDLPELLLDLDPAR